MGTLLFFLQKGSTPQNGEQLATGITFFDEKKPKKITQ